jgi:hypothetical protein
VPARCCDYLMSIRFDPSSGLIIVSAELTGRT